MTAQRITREQIEAEIASSHYFTGFDGVVRAGEHSVWSGDWEVPRSVEALSRLTFCVLVLRNGYSVTGQSACASPENFDAEIGRRLAYEDAFRKLWPLFGFMLVDRLHRESAEGQSVETV